MGTETELLKGPAPTFFGIIVFKLVKGSLFLCLAIVLYTLSDNNLPQEYKDVLAQPTVQTVFHALRVHPGNKFFTHLAEQVGELTEANVLWAAAGTLLYSLFSLVEGTGMIFRVGWPAAGPCVSSLCSLVEETGLIFRVGWPGWMATGESPFFIPIEIYERTRPA